MPLDAFFILGGGGKAAYLFQEIRSLQMSLGDRIRGWGRGREASVTGSQPGLSWVLLETVQLRLSV